MVGHQGIGVYLAAGMPGGIAQPFQIGQVIGDGKEAGLAVVPALHDVQGHAIYVDAGSAGHGE
jgi:hypothetical protein